MATGIIRRIYHAARRVIAHNFATTRLIVGEHKRRENEAHRQAAQGHKAAVSAYKSALRAHQQQARLHTKSVTARVAGVKSTTRQVTKGNRTQRAQQLKQLRANPAQRAALRTRVKYKTKMPSP